MDAHRTQGILFLGEQNGKGESAFKSALCELFTRNPVVEAAYLVRVSFHETPVPQVALCMRGGEQNASSLVSSVGGVFKGIFSTTQHLNVVFLSPAQVVEIGKVAKPFYPISERLDQPA